jgi:hypothetical protein
MNIEQRYEWSLIKTKILSVAAQLESDQEYSKEQAIEELIFIVDMMEK